VIVGFTIDVEVGIGVEVAIGVTVGVGVTVGDDDTVGDADVVGISAGDDAEGAPAASIGVIRVVAPAAAATRMTVLRRLSCMIFSSGDYADLARICPPAPVAFLLVRRNPELSRYIAR
jgi:hypothetical protein